MRRSARSALAAALVTGSFVAAEAAIACSPSEYMTPEELNSGKYDLGEPEWGGGGEPHSHAPAPPVSPGEGAAGGGATGAEPAEERPHRGTGGRTSPAGEPGGAKPVPAPTGEPTVQPTGQVTGGSGPAPSARTGSPGVAQTGAAPTRATGPLGDQPRADPAPSVEPPLPTAAVVRSTRAAARATAGVRGAVRAHNSAPAAMPAPARRETPALEAALFVLLTAGGIAAAFAARRRRPSAPVAIPAPPAQGNDAAIEAELQEIVAEGRAAALTGERAAARD